MIMAMSGGPSRGDLRGGGPGVRALAAGLLPVLLLAACGARERAAIAGAPPPGPAAGERAYSPPPRLTAAALTHGGAVVLAGQANPRSRVRLADPAGSALFADADGAGAWRVSLPPATDVRLFGLSMIEAGRSLQAEGYIAVTPPGPAAQLRSGAGALVIGRRTGGVPRILAVDFDRAAAGRPVAVVVSGSGAPGAAVSLVADGVSRGQVVADADGRFSLALDQPLTAGEHAFAAVQGAGPRSAQDTARIDLTAAAPLPAGPYRARPVDGGWRIDWLTPGGGEQSTVVITRAGAL